MIGGKMLASGGYGCVFSPAINCDGSQLISKKYVSKLQVYNKYAIREIKIGKKITQITGYNTHFVPIIKHCSVQLGEIEDKDKGRCEIFKKKSSKKFTTMKMPFVNGTDFIDFMIKHKDNKFIVNKLIFSYNHLLSSINKLIQNNILHFDLKGTNILFDYDSKLPLIIDFGLSSIIDITDISDNQMKEIFYIFGADYYVWPLEVHYIAYLINENPNPTEDNISDIVKEYVDNNKGLIKNFSPSFIKKYKEKCLAQLKYYNSLQTFEKRKKYIMSFWTTFDNYSLSIMYLKFIHFINTNGYSDNKFIIHFSELLLQNIDPNPENRLDITDTIQKFNGFLTQDIHSGIKVFKNFKKDFIDNKKDIDEVLEIERKTNKIESLKIRKSLA
jgi:serine/threonine protein kinase